jgi:hypothetical protein
MPLGSLFACSAIPFDLPDVSSRKTSISELMQAIQAAEHVSAAVTSRLPTRASRPSSETPPSPPVTQN